MRTLALAALLVPALAGAAAPGDPVRAARLQAPLELDGRLEEPDWDAAPAHDGFLQFFPDDGKPPSERTEVRVLYDDRNLYVGVLCRDTRPEEIRRPLGRRDVIPFSDKVAVFVDSNHDRRTAYVFEVNAAGVQFDELMFGDDQENSDWDAVWEVATAAVKDGWSAEFRLPLSIFRFSAAPSQTWGLAVRRVVARTREELFSIQLRRGERGIVAHFADLTGLDGLEPVQDLSFAPYLAARVTAHPRYADDTRPRPRLVDPSADLGLDVRASLGRGLSLQATLNPDFGQVEADQLVLNLSTFELLFPEKRPFFTQGLDLFQGPTPHNQPSPQQLFYSRRVGLDAPILGAAKVTGRVADEVQVGLLEALVTGAAAPPGSGEDAPARGYRFSGEQPLHFGPARAYPAIAPATRNFVSAVARWQPAATRTLGLSASTALPLDPACTTEQANGSGPRPARCDVLAGTGVALDWNVRDAGSRWFLRGQLSGSHYAGGEFTPQEDPLSGQPLALPPHRVLADGTEMRPGDLGWGGFVAFGRNGGEPWRFDVDVEYESPRLELNAVGYQRTQNEVRLRPIFRYVRPTGGGPFHSIVHGLGGDLRATTDGALRRRAATLFYFNELQLRSFQTFGCEVDLDLPADDVREIFQTGIAFGRPGSWTTNCFVNGDQSRPLYWEVWGGVGRSLPIPAVRTTAFGWAGGLVSIRPHPSVETRVSLSWETDAWPARWVDTAAGAQRFAELTAPFASLALRQLLHLTPRLTFQVYGQLFVATGRYGPWYQGAAAPGGRIRAADLVPIDPPAATPDFHRTDLVLNALLRWDYRVGATIFLVYSRAASERGLPDGERPAGGLAPRGLADGPTTDTFLVKWTWYWAA